MASEYKIKFVNKKEIAEGTMAFYFSKPSGFTCKAGQSMDLTLINPSEIDSKGNTRTFTIAASPYEKNLMIATRVRDTTFKNNLKKMNVGTEIDMVGPYGSFTLSNNPSVPVVFMTGGIGVTPALSIIHTVVYENLPHRIYLFHSNHVPEETPFLNELAKLAEKNSQFVYIPTMTRTINSEKSRNFETGHVDTFMLERNLPEDYVRYRYFISGPMGFVALLQKMLVLSGIDEDNICTEDFPRY